MADATTDFARMMSRLAVLGAEGGSASGVLDTNTTTTTTAGTAEETAYSYSIPANLLSANGRVVRVTAMGLTAANANTKTIRLKVNGTTVPTRSGAFNGVNWRLVCDIVRVSATSVKVGGFVSVGVGTAFSNDLSTGVTVDTTTTIPILLTQETPTSAGDATAHYWLVEVLN